MSDYISTVGELRKALEEFKDDDILYTSRMGVDYDVHGIIFEVIRDNCSPYDHKWCARLTIVE